MVTEEWRTVPGLTAYEVSSLGRVRRCLSGHSTTVGRILTGSCDKDGYLEVHLSQKGRKSKRKVHRLVLEAFVGPKPKGLVTRHLNGVRTDNRLSNLCYGTPKENTEDMERHGTSRGRFVAGERHRKSVLTGPEVKAIRVARQNGYTYASISKIYNIARETVAQVVRGETWKHVK